MLACDLREKGEDADDLEISLVVIVVEESRINQVRLTERKERKKDGLLDAKEHGACKRPPPDCLFSFSSVLAPRYVCVHVERERGKGESARICRKAK